MIVIFTKIIITKYNRRKLNLQKEQKSEKKTFKKYSLLIKV